MLSRREFLTGLGAAGAGTLMSGCSTTFNQVQPARPLIDVHHHMLPPAYLREARDRIIAQGQGFLPDRVLQWSPSSALGEMDENGVSTALLSISTPGVWFGEPEPARRLARACNEYAARLVADHPGRFGFFAAVPLPDSEGSLHEIEYALDVLHADGIGLLTSYGDRWLGDTQYQPVFEELHRRKAVVYVHPTGPNCCRELIPYVPYVFTELPHDTTRAVTSLLFAGRFGRYANIKFIFSHAGGTLPMVVGRISRQSKAMSELVKMVPNGVEYELRKLFYEIAGSANRPAMAALREIAPLSQILFGSDYPWGRISATAGGINMLDLSASDLRALGHGNALTLFPHLSGRLQRPSHGGV